MNKLYLSFFFILCSCSQLVSQIDDNILADQKLPIKRERPKSLKCDRSESILVEDANIIEDYKRITNEYKEMQEGDKLIVLILLQMKYFPHLASPKSKFQFVLKTKGITTYHNLYSNNDRTYPVFEGLRLISKQAKTYLSYQQLIKIVDRQKYIKTNTVVSDFLAQNMEVIKNSASLSKSYIRGDDSLKVGERFFSTPLYSFYKKNNSRKLVRKSDLIKYKNASNSVSCNYNSSLYDKNILLIHKEQIKSIFVGAQIRSTRLIASFNIDYEGTKKSLLNSNYFDGSSYTRSPSFCLFDNSDTVLVAAESRDPHQLLYQLISLKDIRKLKYEDFNSYVNKARYLILKNPDRIIVETNRSDSEELSNLLSLEIPAYQSEKIGKIWGFSKGFVADQRESSSFLCK